MVVKTSSGFIIHSSSDYEQIIDRDHVDPILSFQRNYEQQALMKKLGQNNYIISTSFSDLTLMSK